MPSFLVFLVAFVGIGGKQATKIEAQVGKVLDDSGQVERVKLTKKQRQALVSRAEDAPDIVRELDVDGVIAGEVTRTRKKATLRVVVYDRDGGLMDLMEIPLGKAKAKKLARGDLDSLRETLLPGIEQMTTPPPPPEPVVVADAEQPDTEESAVTATVTPTRRRAREAKISVAAGIGMRTRQYEPGPLMVLGHRSTAVPGGQVAVEVRPMRYLALAGELERTLVMYSEVDSETVPSSMLGWQATAALRLRLGAIELAGLGGVGGRDVVINGGNLAPTPDAHYVYAIAGGRIAARLGGRIEVRAFAMFQPVIGGDDPMDSGAARSGVELGAAVEVSATRRLFVLGEGGYQRFVWSLDGGDATDEYPSATLSLGARY